MHHDDIDYEQKCTTQSQPKKVGIIDKLVKVCESIVKNKQLTIYRNATRFPITCIEVDLMDATWNAIDILFTYKQPHFLFDLPRPLLSFNVYYI